MVLSSRSKCMIITYGRISDHVLPTSKADMWSLWVGRCMHTLVTCIAQSKGDPYRGWYLAKFRSHGTWDIWRV
jgi:hypothetical protein